MYNRKFKGDVCCHTGWYFLDNCFRKLFQKPERIVGEYIAPGDIVVDLGCGPGYFTIDMARMAGQSGTVIAVDLQAEMLEKVELKARRSSVMDRLRLHRCTQDSIGLDGVLADFILACYMVHETPDHQAFLEEVRAILKPGGQFLLIEPVFHVSRNHFDAIIQSALKVGFSIADRPAGKGGRSVLFV